MASAVLGGDGMRNVATPERQATTQKLNEQKFGELLLYIAHKSAQDRHFGAIKLNKILYYVDFAAYRRLGKSITGDEYQHLEEGPAPRHLLPVRKNLVHAGDAEVRQVPTIAGTQQRLVAKRYPDLTIFDGAEIALVDEVLEALQPMNGREVGALAHQELGWRLTLDSETIHYRTAWFSAEPLTAEQIEIGREVAARHAKRQAVPGHGNGSYSDQAGA